MSLKGKGFFIWKIRDCEGGNASTIASVAKASGYTHVVIKIADGAYANNVDTTTKVDFCPPVVAALHAKGIQVWGWHYVYGNPIPEAQMAIKRIKELGLDGYVIDAEVEYQASGMEANAKTFMSLLRKSLPNLPIALCSFRFPSYHAPFPWKAFLDQCDYNMPQVYWEGAHNSDAQLSRCVREFQAMTPSRPIIPTGPIYRWNNWNASADEIKLFMDTGKKLNLPGMNFFAWDYKIKLRPLWDVAVAYNWSGTQNNDLPEQWIAAMNTHTASKVMELYTADAVRITSTQTLQGTQAILNWYTTFLSQTLPNATFKLISSTAAGTSRHFNWQASSSKGKVLNGKDTLGLLGNQISYHYSSYTITPV